jgi:methylated-DNA-protein-cysteine methyltransferase-like protein
MSDRYARIYAVVRRVPRGRVATYGTIARLAKLPGHARQVGYAMFALPAATGIPWQRIVNAKGEISRRSRAGGELTQRMLLQREGIRFDSRGRIDLRRFGWPRSR